MALHLNQLHEKLIKVYEEVSTTMMLLILLFLIVECDLPC